MEPSAPPPLYCEKDHYLARFSKSNPKRLPGGAKTDGIVEGETERLVGLLTALATVKELVLEGVTDGEEAAASSVRRGVHTVGAGNTAGDRSYRRKKR